MRFRDRPLLVGGLDADQYLSRPDIERRLLGPLLAGRNVLLLGESGAGKSTLLRWAEARLQAEDRGVVRVNAALADDVLDLLGMIDGALRQLTLRQGKPVPIGPFHDLDPAAMVGGRSRGEALQRAVRQLRRDEPAVILIDGLVGESTGFDLFGRLRDELWDLGHAWCVAVRPRDSTALRTPPADAFWASIVEIPPLTEDEIRDLIALGLDASDERERAFIALADILEDTFGTTPRSAIRAAQALLGAGDAEPSADPGLLQQHLARLGRSEAMALVELQALGRPVSAQDEELLDRLGWSRPNAQRVLASLEKQQLVRSLTERGERQGRPRKLYEINPSLPPL